MQSTQELGQAIPKPDSSGFEEVGFDSSSRFRITKLSLGLQGCSFSGKPWDMPGYSGFTKQSMIRNET